MAFREREVTGTLVDGDGSPIENAQISFKPTKPIGYTDTHIVVDKVFTVQTNDDGEFSVTLWTDEDSLVPVDYTITFPVANGGSPEPEHKAKLSLVYGTGDPIDIGTVLAASLDTDEGVSGANLASLLDSLLEDKRISNFADVQLDQPVGGGQVLVYDEFLAAWKNGSVQTGVSLGDTIAGSPEAGGMLYADEEGALQSTPSVKLWSDGASVLFTDLSAFQTALKIKLPEEMEGDALTIEDYEENQVFNVSNGGEVVANGLYANEGLGIGALGLENDEGQINATIDALTVFSTSDSGAFINFNRTTGLFGKGLGYKTAASSIILNQGNAFYVDGTTPITSIGTTNVPVGTEITLFYITSGTVKRGGNLQLASDFNAVPGSILRLIFDGSDFYEVSRAHPGGPKRYVALLNQSGTSAPVATVLENTLGGDIVWTRLSAGEYRGTLSGAFPSDRTVVRNGVHGTPPFEYYANVYRGNDNWLNIDNIDSGSQVDGIGNMLIDVTVYPET